MDAGEGGKIASLLAAEVLLLGARARWRLRIFSCALLKISSKSRSFDRHSNVFSGKPSSLAYFRSFLRTSSLSSIASNAPITCLANSLRTFFSALFTISGVYRALCDLRTAQEDHWTIVAEWRIQSAGNRVARTTSCLLRSGDGKGIDQMRNRTGTAWKPGHSKFRERCLQRGGRLKEQRTACPIEKEVSMREASFRYSRFTPGQRWGVLRRKSQVRINAAVRVDTHRMSWRVQGRVRQGLPEKAADTTG